MAPICTGILAAGFSSFACREVSTTLSSFKPKRKLSFSVSVTTPQNVVSTEQQHQQSSSFSDHESFRTNSFSGRSRDDLELEPMSLKDYFQECKELIGSDGGPPRWFSPLECGSRLKASPLLLFLPGIDGVGLGLIYQKKKLGKIFDIWCLHIPVMDRTSFTDLVKMVEETVRSEYLLEPRRPIYLVGESLGGCLALAVAARNPEIDLVLILSNPATCFSKSQLEISLSVSELIPEELRTGGIYMLRSITGIPSWIAATASGNGVPVDQGVGELSQGAGASLFYLSGLVDLLPVETFFWKLKMLKSASSYANSRLHAVKAQTLILSSGKDELLPSQEESRRLRRLLPKCEIRAFNNSGHALFLEDGFDLVKVIKVANFYRRGRYYDYVSDYLPPSASEFKAHYEPYRWTEIAFNPVMLSTLDNGKIVRGLAGIPSEGPIIFVGYHMMIGIDLVPLVSRFWIERNILLRGIAHPMMFIKLREGKLPDLSTFDAFRSMGAVPVSATNFYKLLSSKSHVLLFPGGMREALHRKGEEYKLFWPEQSEFVRMAARFGAKIIPFGTVGEDDVGQLLLDYHDLMKIPYFKDSIEELTDEAVKLRTDSEGEVSNQDVHLPIILPKFPGRFYYFFGKPIETEGRKQELRRREKAHELYLEVKSEVERCIAYLREKRDNDPYRNVLARLMYQSINGFDSEVPTFDI